MRIAIQDECSILHTYPPGKDVLARTLSRGHQRCVGQSFTINNAYCTRSTDAQTTGLACVFEAEIEADQGQRYEEGQRVL